MPTQAREWLSRVPDYSHDGSDTVHEMPALAAALLAAHELDLDRANGILASSPTVSSETWAMRFYTESFVSTLAGNTESFPAKLLALRAAHPAALAAAGLNHALLAIASAGAALTASDATRTETAFSDLDAVHAGTSTGTREVLRAWRAVSTDALPVALADASGPLSEGTATPGVAAELRAVMAVIHLRNDHLDDAASHFRVCLEIVAAERLFDVLHRFSPEELARLEDLSGQRLPDEIRDALATVPPRARRSPRPAVHLTPRERAVLRHLLDGRSRADIAQAEGLSQNTIKTQTASLYRKLNVAHREGAVRAVLAAPELLR